MRILVLNEFNQCIWKVDTPGDIQLEGVVDEDTLDSIGGKWDALMVKNEPRMNYRLHLGEELTIQYYEDNDTRGPGAARTSLGANRVRI